MLPHIVDRPLSLVRCPEGSEKACFYQKHANHTLPPGVESVEETRRNLASYLKRLADRGLSPTADPAS
jgi:DNA primase